MRHRMTVALSLLGVVAVAGTGMEVVRDAQAQQGAEPAAQVSVGRAGAVGTPTSLSQAFRRAADLALPAVVHVQVEGTRMARTAFGEGVQQRVQGAGSGFVIRPDGYILTNNHVVAGAERVTVVTQTRQEYDARVVGRDPNTDLAVIKVDAQDLPVVQFADAERAGVGDWVVALGYPLQLGVTATAGIVSAKGRALGIIERSEEAPAPLEHFIQTDAAINPGNSGGPLIDLDGRVVGVNSAIKSQTGFYSGYGFAIPSNLAKRISDDLIAYGEVRRPKIGVQVQDVTPVDAEVYRLPRVAGAEVVIVDESGPAAAAGIRIGDVVTRVNGLPVEWSADLTERLALMKPGSTASLDLVRYGEALTVQVKLGSFETPRAVAAAAQPERRADPRGLRLGFAAAQGRDGVLITGVAPGSEAQAAGLDRGLVVESINGEKVQGVQDVERAASKLQPGSAISVVVRDGTGARLIVNYRAQL